MRSTTLVGLRVFDFRVRGAMVVLFLELGHLSWGGRGRAMELSWGVVPPPEEERGL